MWLPGDERGEPGAEQVQEQGDDEQPLAPEPVGQPPEDERADHLADEVDRGDQADLRASDMSSVSGL